jgi:hypothetical protein
MNHSLNSGKNKFQLCDLSVLERLQGVGVRKKGSKALSLAESAGCAVKGRKYCGNALRDSIIEKQIL